MKTALVVFVGSDAAAEMTAGLFGAAHPVGGQVCVWALGKDGPAADMLPALPCDEVLWAKNETACPLPEEDLCTLQAMHRQYPAELILFAGTPRGMHLAPRLASRLGGSCLNGVESIAPPDAGGLGVVRGVYGRNLCAGYTMAGKPWCLSLSPGALDALELPAGAPRVRELPPDPLAANTAWCLERELFPFEAEDSIRSAKVLVAGGRGAGGGEGFDDLRRLAAAMGGKVGGTRPAVMDGHVPAENMVGISGAITRPQLCFAMGASGAAAFVAGVEKSGLLVAVNSDPGASIFHCCDVGVVDDCRAVARELLALVSAEGKDGPVGG